MDRKPVRGHTYGSPGRATLDTSWLACEIFTLTPVAFDRYCLMAICLFVRRFVAHVTTSLNVTTRNICHSSRLLFPSITTKEMQACPELRRGRGRLHHTDH